MAEYDQSRPRSFSCKTSLWDKAVKKAGYIPISAIIRRLLEMWVNGEIDINKQSEGGK